jgi:[acyl-carrier-protein] S-malonyltransferase
LFIELGPGKILTGLMERIDKSVQVLPVEDRESLEAAVEQLKR